VHAHVKYTTARPFTPEFVQSHLAAGNKSKSRARALYDERVRRRQIGLVERRNQVSREKKNGKEKEKEKEAVARVRAKMGRREAAEKGVWRLREDEARYVRNPSPSPFIAFFFFFF
jgi:ribonuclease P protein subunit POP4